MEDWQGKRHFKWEAITYICSLSPLFWFLVPILRWKPLMFLGTKFYETIASNRRIAGNFTKPFKFRPLEVRSSFPLTILALLLLAYASIWNLRSFVNQTAERGDVKGVWVQILHKILYRKSFNILDPIGRVTRLDQYWSIFAPGPPKDDGWFVTVAQLEDGSEVDLLRDGNSVSWKKPTIEERDRMYQNMQWRGYFINLNRSVGRNRIALLSSYLCNQWNAKQDSSKRVKTISIYFMDERTVEPGEKQTVTKELRKQHICSHKGV